VDGTGIGLPIVVADSRVVEGSDLATAAVWTLTTTIPSPLPGLSAAPDDTGFTPLSSARASAEDQGATGPHPRLLRWSEPGSMVRRPWWPPRLADVAERSGVSLATASRALARQNGAEGTLPQATEEILTAATELEYM
jgi:hypothetical protein